MRNFFVYKNDTPKILIAVIIGGKEDLTTCFFNSSTYSIYNGPLGGTVPSVLSDFRFGMLPPLPLDPVLPGSGTGGLPPPPGLPVVNPSDDWWIASPSLRGDDYVYVIERDGKCPNVGTAFYNLCPGDKAPTEHVIVDVVFVTAENGEKQCKLKIEPPLNCGVDRGDSISNFDPRFGPPGGILDPKDRGGDIIW